MIRGNKDVAVASTQSDFINIDAGLQTASQSMIIQQGTALIASASPLFITSQTLGSLSDTDTAKDQNNIIKHTVQKGETLSSIADKYNISVETILLANELDSNVIHEGQELLILPVDGLVHMVEKGETVAQIAKDYSADKQEIIDYNGLSADGSVYVGDVLIIPNGKAPKKAAPAQQNSTTTQSYAQVTLPNSYFIVPTVGTITQGGHYSDTENGRTYYNAVDIANAIGTPVVAAAGGTVQIAKNRWPYGNYITILHPNGVITLYAHLSFFGKGIIPGATVSQGQVIGFMGNTGNVKAGPGGNGSHLHFETRGATNPLIKLGTGAKISY
jgi:murein DD-endopeptidase MepM/ murein hydrolase activator NlpD